MSAIDKTDKLLRLSRCPLQLLDKNADNPNKMTKRGFDLLVDNMNETGWTDPALARPLDFAVLQKLRAKHKGNEDAIVAEMLAKNIRLKIVGGHHRFDAASYLGFTTGPVTVIMDADFDADREAFQVVRMNLIHGKLDTNSFMAMYSKLAGKYADDVLQESFGFEDENAFKKLIAQMVKVLPDKVTQDKFKEAAAEVKTIDQLSALLNKMLTTYGDTLSHGYLIVDYGGKDSVWLRMSSATKKSVLLIGSVCCEKNRTMDDVIGGVLQALAKGELKDLVDKIVAATPEVKAPIGLQAMPTYDNIDKVNKVEGAL